MTVNLPSMIPHSFCSAFFPNVRFLFFSTDEHRSVFRPLSCCPSSLKDIKRSISKLCKLTLKPQPQKKELVRALFTVAAQSKQDFNSLGYLFLDDTKLSENNVLTRRPVNSCNGNN